MVNPSNREFVSTSCLVWAVCGSPVKFAASPSQFKVTALVQNAAPFPPQTYLPQHPNLIRLSQLVADEVAA